MTAALVGTERQAVAVPVGDGALGALLARVAAAEPDAALLRVGAVLALYERAGWVPPTDPTPGPEAAPPDTQPRVNARAGQHLATMLSGQYDAVLGEWLAAAGTGGWRVPEELLPDLLELGRANPTLRSALGPVLGERGRWLAAQNPDWAYVSTREAVEAALDIDTLWVTNVRGMRLSLLGQLRAADPDGARERVAGTWGEESAEDRVSFLAAFRTGLSMSDEPFLEAALDDRRKEVRLAAADLLARLPEFAAGGADDRAGAPVAPVYPGATDGVCAEAQAPGAAGCDAPRCVRQGDGPGWGGSEAADDLAGREGVVAAADAGGGAAAGLDRGLGGDAGRPGGGGDGQRLERGIDPRLGAGGGTAGDAGLGRAVAVGPPGTDGGVWPERIWWTCCRPTTREELILRLLEEDLKPSYGNHPVLFFLRHSRHPWSATLTRRVLALAWERSVDADGQRRLFRP